MTRACANRLIMPCALALIASAVLAAPNSICDARRAVDGARVRLTGKVVSGRLWGDRFYILEPNLGCGIAVLSGVAVSAGQIVTVDGYKTTIHGEPHIGVPAVSVTSSTAAPEPVGLSSASLLSGPETTGRPVRVWGRTTSALQSDTMGSYFAINDGGTKDVRVYVGNTGAQPPAAGTLTVVRGISGINGTTPVVLISSPEAIQTYPLEVDLSGIPDWVWSAAGIARVPLDLSAVVAACADGADVIEVPVQDVWYCYYPSTVATPSPTYGDGVLLQQIIAYAHGHGAKVVGAMPACKDASCLTAHTDWRQRPTDSTIWLTKPADQVTGCLVSPFGGYLVDEIVELAVGVGLDGVSLQGYSNTQAFCYCTYCKARYLADTGYSIPGAVNYDNANFRRYLGWHDATIVEHLNGLRDQVKSARPDFGIFAWSSNAGEYSHYLASPHVMPTGLNALLDCAMQRGWYDDANLGLSVIPDFGLRYMNGLARGRPWLAEADYTTRAADTSAGVSASSLPEAEVQFRLLAAIAAGGKVSFSSTEKQHLRPSLFALARARSAWTYRAKPMKWAAMVVSETARQLYGRSDAVGKYMQSCFGFYRTMLEYHLPVDIITESDLEAGLGAGYKVLILPNTACLSSASVSAIRGLVASGVGLVATGAASLYDDEGAAQSNYVLADLYRVGKSGGPVTLQYQAAVVGDAYARNSAVLGKLLSPYGHITSYSGELFPVNVLPGGSTLATVCSDLGCSTKYPMYVSNPNTGAGRVAYFPASLDAANYRYSYPYQGVLLKDAVTWAAGSPPSVTVAGPKTLQATFFTQNNGKRLVIHLLNATNSRAGRAHPAGDLPARDEITPIYDIEVWFENASPISVKLQPGNQALQLVQQGGRTRVIVPELQQHSMVVAELP